jgi:hypothetical protein
MRDPLMVLAFAEAILFFISWGLLLQTKCRRAGRVLFVVWGLVLIAGIAWGLARRFSEAAGSSEAATPQTAAHGTSSLDWVVVEGIRAIDGERAGSRLSAWTTARSSRSR